MLSITKKKPLVKYDRAMVKNYVFFTTITINITF